MRCIIHANPISGPPALSASGFIVSNHALDPTGAERINQHFSSVLSWKFVVYKYSKIAVRHGKNARKTRALRAFFTQHRGDCQNSHTTNFQLRTLATGLATLGGATEPVPNTAAEHGGAAADVRSLGPIKRQAAKIKTASRAIT